MRAMVSGQVVGTSSFKSTREPGKTVQIVSLFDGGKSIIEIFDYPGSMPTEGEYLNDIPVSITKSKKGDLFVFALKN